MKVLYLGRRSRRTNSLPSRPDDFIELLWDDWDDFGFKTSFPTVCKIDGEEVELGLLRLLIDDVEISKKRLDELREHGWDGTFPIPDTNYISTPAEITFYEQLEGLIGAVRTVEVAKQLRDASYLIRVANDNDARAMVESEGFESSLQRERGSIKAFLDGWKIFDRQNMSVLDLRFRFVDVFHNESMLKLRFQPANILPHDVNVLIGPNGAGKSQLLHQIVTNWLDPSDTDSGFVEKPNLSQLVVVSYSPFERFPVDSAGYELQDNATYRYFGFRGRSKTSAGKSLGRIRLSHEFPKRDAAESLIRCVVDDKRYHAIRGWARKVQTMERVLRFAFEFDLAALEVQPESRGEFESIRIDDGGSRRYYIPIRSESLSSSWAAAPSGVRLERGVAFFKSRRPIKLSSGQRLFAYIVINILGAIRRNSLILIDEPELFLHPTLEIQFIAMLKQILEAFDSKALLATHSVVTVREIPEDCVHVFNRTEDGLVISHPPFQTFGGDTQRISSYVFGDRSASKPFETWIGEHVRRLGSAQKLINSLGDKLNEELIVQIKAWERGDFQ